MLDFEILCGGICSVMEKIYYIYGAEVVLYLLILCELYCCPMAIILILYLSLSYHLQMGRGDCGCIGHTWYHSYPCLSVGDSLKINKKLILQPLDRSTIHIKLIEYYFCPINTMWLKLYNLL